MPEAEAPGGGGLRSDADAGALEFGGGGGRLTCPGYIQCDELAPLVAIVPHDLGSPGAAQHAGRQIS